MEVLNDSEIVNRYILKFGLDRIFAQDMSGHMKLFRFQKGELVCSINDNLEWFYFVVKGKLKIYTIVDNGKSILLRFCAPMSVIGDLEISGKYLVKANVEALNESLLIGIKMKDIEKYAYDDAVFLRFVIENLGHKLYTISNAASMNLLYPFVNRFASYLVSITSDENNNRMIDEIRTSNLTELAALLGTSYRHLNRVISDLEMKGIIRRTRGGIAILDYDKLKELSGGYYE